MSAGTVTRSFFSQYNVLDRLINVTDQLGTGTKLSEYGYDDLDRVRTIDNQGTRGVARVLLTYGHEVVPILHQKRTQDFAKLMPTDSTQLEEGDRLIILATLDGLQRIERRAASVVCADGKGIFV